MVSVDVKHHVYLLTYFTRITASVQKQDPNTVIGFTTYHCHSQQSSKHTEHTNTETDKYIFIFRRLTVSCRLENGLLTKFALFFFCIAILNERSF